MCGYLYSLIGITKLPRPYNSPCVAFLNVTAISGTKLTTTKGVKMHDDLRIAARKLCRLQRAFDSYNPGSALITNSWQGESHTEDEREHAFGSWYEACRCLRRPRTGVLWEREEDSAPYATDGLACASSALSNARVRFDCSHHCLFYILGSAKRRRRQWTSTCSACPDTDGVKLTKHVMVVFTSMALPENTRRRSEPIPRSLSVLWKPR